MKQIILKDKILYITEDTYEIKRLKGKWVQSFFELVAIRNMFAIIIISLYMILLMSLLKIKIEFSYFSGIFVVGLFMLVSFFLRYYNDISIPIEKIQKTYIDKRNQLIISFLCKKRVVNKVINLPKEEQDRERAINELQKERIIQNRVPETPYASDKRVHKMNLYMGIIGVFISFLFYVVLFNLTNNQWALILNSIILLFCSFAIIFSLYNLSKIKNLLQVK